MVKEFVDSAWKVRGKNRRTIGGNYDPIKMAKKYRCEISVR
jgi:hypothetical protein